MTTTFDIPLTSSPQTASITLAGVSYKINLKWNNISSCWVVDLLDSLNNLILGGIPLVTGCDLLGQFEYLSIGGDLFAEMDNSATAVPQFQDLGNNGHLYFVTPT